MVVLHFLRLGEGSTAVPCLRFQRPRLARPQSSLWPGLVSQLRPCPRAARVVLSSVARPDAAGRTPPGIAVHGACCRGLPVLLRSFANSMVAPQDTPVKLGR